jgi:hypothetical protein
VPGHFSRDFGSMNSPSKRSRNFLGVLALRKAEDRIVDVVVMIFLIKLDGGNRRRPAKPAVALQAF